MNRYMVQSRGVAVVEILVAVAIMTIVMIGIFRFQTDTTALNANIQGSFSTDEQVRKILRPLADELRSASPSSLGEYSILQAGTSSITFFADIDGGGDKERVRYFMSGTTLKRGIVKASGNPLVYNTAGESINTLVSDLKNDSSTPVFTYFNSTYTGSSTDMALVQPVSVTDVRLVKINFVINAGAASASAVTRNVTTSVMLRNLKDNL